jgi:hypothetical protein
MTATTKVPLGPSTPAGKWYLDVNTGTESVPVWLKVGGIGEFKPLKDPSVQDSSDFDSDWGGDEVSDLKWGLEFKAKRKVQSASFTAYDAGQEFLRAASDGVLSTNRVQVRWYEMVTGGPRVEAYSGWVAVAWNPDGGDKKALDIVSAKLYGQGTRTPITHPDTVAVVPVVSSILPITGVAAGGEAAYIAGQFFTGVTAVKIGVTAVTDYQLVSDYGLAIVTPAKTAGPYTVYVTNATGTNATGPTFTYS